VPAVDRHLALVGLMGAGKSTVGRRLASAWGRAFVDLDDAIVAAAGRPIPELFAAEGEAGFRDRETAALRAALAEPTPLVVATGGGVVLREENRALLGERAVVVWLDAEVDALAARVGDGTGRPLLADAPAERLRSLATARRPLYEAVADLRVDTSGLGPDEVVTAVVAGLAAEVAS
jgi:shikimate kinase